MLDQLSNSYQNLKPTFRSFLGGATKSPRRKSHDDDYYQAKNKKIYPSRKIKNLDVEETMEITKLTQKIKEIEKAINDLGQQSKS